MTDMNDQYNEIIIFNLRYPRTVRAEEGCKARLEAVALSKASRRGFASNQPERLEVKLLT